MRLFILLFLVLFFSCNINNKENTLKQNTIPLSTQIEQVKGHIITLLDTIPIVIYKDEEKCAHYIVNQDTFEESLYTLAYFPFWEKDTIIEIRSPELLTYLDTNFNYTEKGNSINCQNHQAFLNNFTHLNEDSSLWNVMPFPLRYWQVNVNYGAKVFTNISKSNLDDDKALEYVLFIRNRDVHSWEDGLLMVLDIENKEKASLSIKSTFSKYNPVEMPQIINRTNLIFTKGLEGGAGGQYTFFHLYRYCQNTLYEVLTMAEQQEVSGKAGTHIEIKRSLYFLGKDKIKIDYVFSCDYDGFYFLKKIKASTFHQWNEKKHEYVCYKSSIPIKDNLNKNYILQEDDFLTYYKNVFRRQKKLVAKYIDSNEECRDLHITLETLLDQPNTR